MIFSIKFRNGTNITLFKAPGTGNSLVNVNGLYVEFVSQILEVRSLHAKLTTLIDLAVYQ